MPVPQIAPLPPFFELSDGMVIRVTAVDAATNATVSGVVISGVSIDVDTVAPSAPETAQPLTAMFIPAGVEG